jgi:DNA-directed RNA polymerase specialized sigma24 family protein
MNPHELEGDLCEWAEGKEMEVTGLNALKFPAGSSEFSSGSGKPPQPDYFPNSQIQALNNAIENLEEKYKDILILKYVLKLIDATAAREAGCHRANVPKRIEKAKHLLVKSRYWTACKRNKL